MVENRWTHSTPLKTLTNIEKSTQSSSHELPKGTGEVEVSRTGWEGQISPIDWSLGDGDALGIGLEVAGIKDNQSNEIAKPPSALDEFPIDFPVLLQCKAFWFAKTYSRYEEFCHVKSLPGPSSMKLVVPQCLKKT